MHNYHDEHGSFPPAYIADASGKPMHSWRVLILPYLDEKGLYRNQTTQKEATKAFDRSIDPAVPRIALIDYNNREAEDAVETARSTAVDVALLATTSDIQDVVRWNLGLIEELLDAHIRFEERVLFNEIQTVASPGELEEIGTRHSDHATAIDAEEWEDQFWLS